MEKNYHKTILIFLILFVFGLIFLQYARIIDVQGLLNPNSPHYMKWWEVWQPEKTEVIPIPPSVCPKTTCEITKPCCGYRGNPDDPLHSPSVSAVPIPASCPCPEDTEPEPLGMDNIAPGGPYKICGCLGKE